MRRRGRDHNSFNQGAIHDYPDAPGDRRAENILQREGKIASGVRISATNGECSGPNYEMAIESDSGPDDTVIEIREVRLFAAPRTRECSWGSLSITLRGRRFGLHLRKPRGGSGEFEGALRML